MHMDVLLRMVFWLVFNTGVELVENPEISISPNPAKHTSTLKINLKNIPDPLNICLYNALGSLMTCETRMTSSGQYELKAPDIPGIYYFSIDKKDILGIVKKIVVY